MLLVGAAPGKLFSEQDSIQRIRRFFEENLIIDGTMQPLPLDGTGWPREPGKIQRLTGVDVAAMTVGPETSGKRIARGDTVICFTVTSDLHGGSPLPPTQRLPGPCRTILTEHHQAATGGNAFNPH
ncbi:MAG: hypothetical protein WD490_07240 [Opitutales bacterium]